MELIIKRVTAMKKILTILTTAVLVASMAMPAFAVGFVNSVTGSGSPTFVGGGTGGLGNLSGGTGIYVIVGVLILVTLSSIACDVACRNCSLTACCNVKTAAR